MRPLDVVVSDIVPFFDIVVSSSFCLHFSFVYCPCRVFASCECFFQGGVLLTLNSSLLEQMVFALCCNEPTTLYLDETVWLLSHWRYRSMCVGFLYTVVFRFPSSSGIIRTSRKGMEPSLPASSLLNWMCSSILFRCSRKLVLWDDCRMVKVSSTNLLQKRGDVVLYWWLGFQIASCTGLPQWDL